MENRCSLFASLAEPLRLQALLLLTLEGELCVCELTHAMQVEQPRMSKHLASLRAAGLVRDRREAQWVLYAPAPDLPDWAAEIVAATVRGLAEDAAVAAARRRLASMPNRPPHRRAA